MGSWDSPVSRPRQIKLPAALAKVGLGCSTDALTSGYMKKHHRPGQLIDTFKAAAAEGTPEGAERAFAIAQEIRASFQVAYSKIHTGREYWKHIPAKFRTPRMEKLLSECLSRADHQGESSCQPVSSKASNVISIVVSRRHGCPSQPGTI